MDITKCRIDMKVRTKSGYEGKITGIWSDEVRIETDDGIRYATPNCIEPVSDPCFAIGDKVRATGKSLTFGDCVEGKIGKIDELSTYSGVECANVRWPTGDSNVIPLSQLTKCDQCASCEMAPVITSQCKQIADLQLRLDISHTRFGELDLALGKVGKERDVWKAEAHRHCRNAAYWREELTKLQKEALAEYEDFRPFHIRANRFITGNFYCGDERKPLSEVAKCYIRVAPEKLLMSQEARRVVEYIAAKGGSLDIDAICGGLKCCMDYLCDHLAEARDAGRISLVNGKYEIVRD